MAGDTDTYLQLLNSIPHIIMRLEYADPAWRVVFINKAVERWGYSVTDFGPGKTTWNDILHPDDRIVALKQSHDYMAKNIDDFKLQYRVLTRDGESIYITEYSHVNRNADGSRGSIDSYLVENLEAADAAAPEADITIRRRLALNDILLTVLDANTEPEKAIEAILSRVGTLLDCCRALLFRDSPDHKTCKVAYEWDNHGISSVKDLDYAVWMALNSLDDIRNMHGLRKGETAVKVIADKEE